MGRKPARPAAQKLNVPCTPSIAHDTPDEDEQLAWVDIYQN
jgi:hypothetical protein